MADKKPQLQLGRPADRSLEAYKKFITDMTERILPGAPNTITDEKWLEYHKKFWEGVDKGKAKK